MPTAEEEKVLTLGTSSTAWTLPLPGTHTRCRESNTNTRPEKPKKGAMGFLAEMECGVNR